MKEKFSFPSSQDVPRRYEPDAEGFESHQLDMDEIETIPAGDEAYIPGLGPCLGIVLYDPQTREAVAAHLVLRTRLNKLLDQARKTFQDLSRVKVFAAGVSPEADDPISNEIGGKGLSKRYQEELVAELKAVGISAEAMDLRFNPNPKVGVDLVFDTRTGEMTVETFK